jgi:hypothetical protein
MAFHYDAGYSNIANDDFISAVRFALQDTVEDEQEFDDFELIAQYDATLSTDVQTVRNLATAVTLARVLQRRYAKQASFSSQGTSIQLLERAKFWATMIADLESDLMVARVAAGQIDQGGILYAGRATSFIDQTALDLGASGHGGSLGGVIIGGA